MYWETGLSYSKHCEFHFEYNSELSQDSGELMQEPRGLYMGVSGLQAEVCLYQLLILPCKCIPPTGLYSKSGLMSGEDMYLFDPAIMSFTLKAATNRQI